MRVSPVFFCSASNEEAYYPLNGQITQMVAKRPLLIQPTRYNHSSKLYVIGSDCGPCGLSINIEKQQARLGCSGPAEILGLKSGKIVKTISAVTDADEVWFNKGDGRYYFGSFAFGAHQSALRVVDAEGSSFVTNIQLHDANFHGAAADGKGIVVYRADDSNSQ